MTEPSQEQNDRIRVQLEKILASATFAGSERHRRFLEFVVNQALKGNTDKLNEFVLGFEVFNKNESFDPRIDSIVRVEARRLRERLRKYYQDEGRGDPLEITLRPRSFVPEFADRAAAGADTGSSSIPGAAASGRLRAWLPLHKTVAVALAGLLCGAVAMAVLLLRGRRPTRPETASLVVLPFQPLGAVSDPELGNGVSDAFITGLAGTPGLRVISRGSAIQIEQSGGGRSKLVTDLHVDYILEGTVRERDKKVTVSAKLTDIRTQSYLWAETRETTLSQLPDVERELIAGMVGRIRLPLPSGTSERVARRRAATPEAYGAFLKGQYYFYQGDPQSMARSAEFFEAALRGDPNFAPAWAWLAQCYLFQDFVEEGRNPAVLAKGRQAAAKALALDPDCAEAQAAAGGYAALDWNWDEADRDFRRAIELNPDWAPGHLMYSILCLAPTGRTREAVFEAIRARDLDPLTRPTRFLFAEVLYLNRDYARAIAETEDLQRAEAVPPGSQRAYYLSLSLSGQSKRALAELRSRMGPEGDDPMSLPLYGYLLAVNGERAAAASILKRLVEKTNAGEMPAGPAILVAVGLGDRGEAIRLLQAAVNKRVPAAPQAAGDPAFAPLRDDPRFADLLRQMGLPASH